MPLQEDYRVRLDTFQGPLDLLLYLIRRAEVDITDIPVSEIADQYLKFLAQVAAVDEIDVELAGEFLVMAATLIELKSRTIAPPEETDGGDAGGGSDRGGGEPLDPRTELVQQLMAYQRFRVVADDLDKRRTQFAMRFPRVGGRSAAAGRQEDPELELELEDVHLMDLSAAYERIMSAIDLSRLGDHVIEMDDTPIALHQEDLLDRLGRSDAGRLTLQATFAGCNPSQRVGLFLATLELARTRRVAIAQDDLEGDIELRLRDPEELEEDATA